MRGAGKFDKRVNVLEKNEAERDEYGQPTDRWEVRFQRWADIATAGGREFRQNEQTQAEVSHKIFLRSDSQTRNMTPKHRIEYRGRTFELTKAVDLDEDHMEISCDCKEVLACQSL